jgi:hypothetical protein
MHGLERVLSCRLGILRSEALATSDIGQEGASWRGIHREKKVSVLLERKTCREEANS